MLNHHFLSESYDCIELLHRLKSHQVNSNFIAKSSKLREVAPNETCLTVWIIGTCCGGAFFGTAPGRGQILPLGESQAQLFGHFGMIQVVDVIEDAAAGHFHLKTAAACIIARTRIVEIELEGVV